MTAFEHSWTDISRHGSAWYQCEYCTVYKNDVKHGKESPDCLKAEARLELLAEREIQKEKSDYARMKKELEYFFYLEEKYAE